MVAVQATTSTLTADHFATDVAPRWGDLDAQGHVNNSLVADYLQEARADFLMNGPNRHLLGGGVVVVAHQLEYQRPVEFTGAPVRVELWPVKVGAARFELAYRATHEGHDVFRARTVLCPFANSPAMFRPSPSLPGTSYPAMPTSPQTSAALGTSRTLGSRRASENATRVGGCACTIPLRSGRAR